MAFSIKITTRGLVPKISRDDIIRLKTSTMLSIAKAWHKRYSQFKFTTAAARKYNYTKRKTKDIRTGEVRRVKRGKFKGRRLAPTGLPLVWTGETRGLAKITTYKASSRKSKVTSPINKLNFRPKGAYPNLNMRREYTRVLPSEERRLGKDAEKHMRSLFDRKKKNIRVIFDD